MSISPPLNSPHLHSLLHPHFHIFLSPPHFLSLKNLPKPPHKLTTSATDPNRFSQTSNSKTVPGQLGLDELLSFGELLCVAPPVVYSVGCLLSFALPAVCRRFQPSLGSRVFAIQYFLLVGGLVIGSLIRWRQWRRICRVDERGESVGLVARVEKVEEDLRSSVGIIRVLSRQLEKLGVRFRVTRRTIKEPIAETAALAQKNSEATRALTMQVDNLEKELGEIQKVLLAMQEQQQKQLELILAIGKAGRLLNPKRDSPIEQHGLETGNSIPEKSKTEELETH